MKPQSSLATALLLLGALVVPIGMAEDQTAQVCPRQVQFCVPPCEFTSSIDPCHPLDCGDDGCVPDVCDLLSPESTAQLPGPVPTAPLPPGTPQTCIPDAGSCPEGQTGAAVGNVNGCFSLGQDGPCTTVSECEALVCQMTAGDSECDLGSLPCGGEDEYSCTEYICGPAVGNVRCDAPTTCGGEPILQCLHLCEEYGTKCLPGTERPYFAPIDGRSAAMKYASSSANPGEANCFVYATTWQEPEPWCKGAAQYNGRLQAYGWIYCVHDNECSTSGALHTSVFDHDTNDPYSPYYDISGYRQFYAGFGTGCNESGDDCQWGDWSPNVRYVVGSTGKPNYSYDISKTGWNKYGNGSPCTANGPYHEYYNPNPIWMCEPRGGYGAFAAVEPN